MIFHRTTFDTCEGIVPRNAYLDNDNIVRAIGMGSIVVEVLVRGKIKIICIEDASMCLSCKKIYYL